MPFPKAAADVVAARAETYQTNCISSNCFGNLTWATDRSNISSSLNFCMNGTRFALCQDLYGSRFPNWMLSLSWFTSLQLSSCKTICPNPLHTTRDLHAVYSSHSMSGVGATLPQYPNKSFNHPLSALMVLMTKQDYKRATPNYKGLQTDQPKLKWQEQIQHPSCISKDIIMRLKTEPQQGKEKGASKDKRPKWTDICAVQLQSSPK